MMTQGNRTGGRSEPRPGRARFARLAVALGAATMSLTAGGLALAAPASAATRPARDAPPTPVAAPTPVAKPVATPKATTAPKTTTAPKATTPAKPKTTSPPKSTKPPSGAKFLCKDGTYSFVKSSRSACLGHRGVQRAV
jgi:hypothetical protein